MIHYHANAYTRIEKKPLTGAAVPLYNVRMQKLIQVRLPDDMHKRLMEEAARQERGASTLVRRLIREALDRTERKPAEA